MPKNLLETLLDEAGEGAEDLALLASLVKAAQAAQAARTGGLAEAEYAEGLWAEEPEALDRATPLRLAADDRPAIQFPAIYENEDWEVVVGRDERGVPYVALERAPADAEVVVAESLVLLAVEAEQSLEGLSAPPASVDVRVGSGAWLRLDGGPL